MGGKEGSSLMTFELRPKKKGMAMKIFWERPSQREVRDNEKEIYTGNLWEQKEGDYGWMVTMGVMVSNKKDREEDITCDLVEHGKGFRLFFPYCNEKPLAGKNLGRRVTWSNLHFKNNILAAV